MCVRERGWLYERQTILKFEQNCHLDWASQEREFHCYNLTWRYLVWVDESSPKTQKNMGPMDWASQEGHIAARVFFF